MASLKVHVRAEPNIEPKKIAPFSGFDLKAPAGLVR
jgi:hypothetical protein